MCYTPFQPVVYLVRVTVSIRCDSSVRCTCTHNPSLQPFSQRNQFSLEVATGQSKMYCTRLQARHSSCELSTNYGALVDLFGYFESFPRRFDAYTIPITIAMTDITIKILIESLSNMSLAIQQVRAGRAERALSSPI